MKRELSFLSPISVAFTIVVLAGLGFSLWKSGGLAFNPGPVTAQARPGVTLQGFASHADFEQECQRCHQPLATDQTDLCTRCHENITAQRAAGTGTHGQIDLSVWCADCHPEHEGRSSDPVAFAVSHFDHNQTRLPLTGAHAALECETCHRSGDYGLTYQGCTDCHAEPALHAGMFEQSCDACHTDLFWRPAMIDGQTFDHDRTRFSLVRHTGLPAGKDIVCADCHTLGSGEASLQTCTACHRDLAPVFMDDHLQTMGTDCLQCHDGTDRMAGFDHTTVFPLDGQHASLECSACHADFRFQGTSTDCSGCHAEPEIHTGFFGTECQKCHTTQAWTPALLSEHTFPLDHGEQGEQTCQTCHPDSYPEYTCYTCHEHQPEQIAGEHREEGISTEELAQCAQCHPTGREEEGEGDDD